MAGTQGWTDETWKKLRDSGAEHGTKAVGSYQVKICGKAHSACKICKPDMWTHQSRESHLRTAQQAVERGTFAGSNNPRWKGGVGNSYGSGWKEARRLVWARDKVCRACGLSPYSNRRLDVHHIISRRDGGTHGMDNLVGLHHGCHMKVEAGKMQII